MILVTGGTGLVGTHLIYHLVNKGLPVTAIYREGKSFDEVKKVFSYYCDQPEEIFSAIRWVEADLNDLPALEKAFRGITHVYHCAALISFDPRDFNRLKQVNIGGTANIVNLCMSQRIKKLCYVSSIATIGRGDGPSGNTEDSDWNDNDRNVYALTKYDAEMEVWRAYVEGLPMVIVNPGVILGPGFWNNGSGQLFKISARGTKYYPPGGSGFITVQDVIRIMVGLMDSAYEGERYILIDKNLTYREILSNIAREFGKQTPKKQIKIWQLYILCFLDWARNVVSGKPRLITRRGIVSLKERPIYDNKKIVEALNYEFELMAESIYFNCNRFKESYPGLFS